MFVRRHKSRVRQAVRNITTQEAVAVRCAAVRKSSKDAYCNLPAGGLLRSLTFPASIHSVITDPGDHALYAGAGDGQIFETSLVGQLTDGVGNGDRLETGYYTLEGNTAAVTCLAVTADATQLLSGEWCANLQGRMATGCTSTAGVQAHSSC